MDAGGLARGLEQLIDLAASVDMTTRIYTAYTQFVAQVGHRPNHIVMAPDVWADITLELNESGFFIRETGVPNHLFGMTIEIAPLGEGEFFVGEQV